MRNIKKTVWLVVIMAIVCALTLAVALPASADENANVDENTNVAKVGDKEYATLDEAILEGTPSGGGSSNTTITLIRDVEVTATVTIPADKNITLDLNGYTLTSSATTNGISVAAGAELVITGNGTITATTGKYTNAIENSGSLTIENGTFVGAYGAVRALGGSATVINGGTFSNSDTTRNNSVYCYANGTKLTVTINDGTFKNMVSNGSGSVEQSNVTLTVNGGSFKNDLSDFCGEGYGTILNKNTNTYDYGALNVPASYVEDENGNVTISDEEALRWFAAQVNRDGNTFAGKTVTLAADITLTRTWAPVGVSVAESFRGTFDGAGHTISGMKVEGTYQGYGFGFFKTIVSATVKNVTFDNANVTGVYSNIVGTVVGYSYGSSTFENVHVTNSTVYAFGKVGGIVGYAEDKSATTTFKSCSVEDSTIHVGYNGAGFLGLVQGRCEVTGSYLRNNTVKIDENAQGFGEVTELDTTVACDGSVATCAGNGTVIKGRYLPRDGYYWSAYSDLYNHYGDSSHDCTLADGKLLANSEVTHDALVTIVRGKAEYLFSDLQGAFDFANDGETVKLLADIYVTEGLNIKDKKITLDLNGKTIANTADIWNIQPALLCIENSAVTITGSGKMLAKENDCYTINLVSGLLTIENGEYVGNVSAVQVVKGTLTINGGTFSLLQKWEGKSTYLINCIDDTFVDGEAVVAIKGGKFVDFDPNNSPEKKVNGVAPSFAAPGVGITKDTDGNFAAVEGMVAQVYDENHESVAAHDNLNDAINATKSGYTVKLLADATMDITFDKNITLDLGGFTLTGTGASGTATLTIVKGVTVTVKNGTIRGTANSYYTIENKGTATFVDLTAIAGNTGSSMLANSGTLTITSGTYEGGLNTVINKSGATLTIDGGTFSTNYAENNAHTGVLYNLGNLTVNDGTFTHTATTAPMWAYPHVIMTAYEGTKPSTVIRGGTFISTLNNYKATVINHDGAGSVGSTKIFGGTFNMKVDESYCAEGFAPMENSDGTYGVEQLIKIVATEGVLGESIKFYILTNRSGDLKFRIKVTLNGEEVIYEGIEYEKDGEKYYAYILDLPPQYLDTTLKIELVNNDDETIQTVEYSFLKYCEAVLKEDESAKQLIADLLWYSVAAKNKCGLESTTLVNKLKKLGLVQSTGDVKATVEKSHTATGDNKLISGATLYHDSVNRIIILVEKDAYANAEGTHTFTYKKADGKAQALANIGELEIEGTTYVMLATDGIYANEFDTKYTIEVSDGTNIETLVYSVNTYCEVKAATNALAKALYYYGESAKAYKH